MAHSNDVAIAWPKAKPSEMLAKVARLVVAATLEQMTRRLPRLTESERSSRLPRMKRLSSTVVASLLASVAIASVAPAFAAVIDAAPQCGGEKDDKSGTSKPAPAPAPAPKPPS